MIVWELHIFQKKLTNSEETKISSQIFIQANNAIMCGYLCIGFIAFMLKGKILLDYTDLFSPNHYEKNDKIILKYFQ